MKIAFAALLACAATALAPAADAQPRRDGQGLRVGARAAAGRRQGPQRGAVDVPLRLRSRIQHEGQQPAGRPHTRVQGMPRQGEGEDHC